MASHGTWLSTAAKAFSSSTLAGAKARAADLICTIEAFKTVNVTLSAVWKCAGDSLFAQGPPPWRVSYIVLLPRMNLLILVAVTLLLRARSFKSTDHCWQCSALTTTWAEYNAVCFLVHYC